MKVDEIVISPEEYLHDSTVMKDLLARDLPASHVVTQVTTRSSLNQVRAGYYLMVTDDHAIGRISLAPNTVVIHDHAYTEIDNIYVLPEYRKTWVVGVMLIAAKKNISTPLILGTRDTDGGLLFAGGQQLVSALLRKRNLFIKVLNLATGEITTLPSNTALPEDPDLTLVFERTNYPISFPKSGMPPVQYLFEGCEIHGLDQPFKEITNEGQ